MIKSNAQKALKIVSIILIVFSALGIVIGLLGAVGISAVFVEPAAAGNQDASIAGGFLFILTGLAILSSLFSLILGIFGVRGANDPQKIGVFFVLTIIAVVVTALDAIAMISFGITDVSSLVDYAVSFCLPVGCLAMAITIKKENEQQQH